MKKILSAVLACTATMALVATTASATDAGATDPAGSEGVKYEEVEIKSELTLKDGKLELKGADAAKELLTKDGKTYTWADVEEVVFAADKTFSVSFAADKAKAGVDVFVLGVDELDDSPADVAAVEGVRAASSSRWATKWTLTDEHIAVFAATPEIDLASEDGKELTVTATATVKVAVDAGNDDNNPPTGIALAIAPAGLAVAFVTVAAVMNKKKRG